MQLARTSFAAVVVFSSLALAASAVPTQILIHSQGRVVDATDAPVNGPLTIAVTLFDSHDGPPQTGAWTETYAVTAAQGFYSITLGDPGIDGAKKALTPGDVAADRWLGVSIGGEPLLPRLHLGVVPYAVGSSLLGGKSLDDLDARYAPANGGAAYVNLQGVTPGAVQVGGLSVSGTVSAGKFTGDGSGLSGVALAGHNHDGHYPLLQTATPGTPDIGNLNVSGAVIAASATVGTLTATTENVSGAFSAASATVGTLSSTTENVAGTLTAKVLLGDGTGLSGLSLATHNHDDRYVRLTGTGTGLSVGDVTSSGTVTATAFKIGSTNLLSMFDGMVRPCANGAGNQTFNGTTGVWSTCPAAWNCSATPSHAGCASSSQYRSCKDIRADVAFNGSDGLYYVDVDGSSGGLPPMQVYCDMSTEGGGWTLVMRNNGSNWAHDDCNTVGSLTAPDQATTAKLSDQAINAIGATVYKLSCKSLITYWDATSRPFNACSQGGQNKRGKNSLNDQFSNLGSDDNGRGMAAGDGSVGANMYYGYTSANSGTPGCHTSGWGGSGWMMAR